ncbi:MAG TPA: polyprenyl synthetase family protein [Solirubrobacteraceae bacterium]|jgi:geranylgeranyl pyrophosphate synthase|nr:polyprenyl synthetase family protein [Solirubrobacteraceae bacterium]
MRERMDAAETRLLEIGAEHPDGLRTIEAGGKRLRPLLVFIAGLDGRDSDQLVRGAVAVELIHSATLVHDDTLDAAPLRRGRRTVFASGGRPAATAIGDLLFARAFAELARNGSVDQLRVLSAASSALAGGELIQREDAWSGAVSVARYLHRCELKTASLFEAACELGAIASGAISLEGFGMAIGTAFQILDDVLDVTGPPERTGKRRGTDLIDGTVTLPLIEARRRDPTLAALDLRSIDDPEDVCDRILATGANDLARKRAHALVTAAKAGLPAALGADQRRALELVADGVVERYA